MSINWTQFFKDAGIPPSISKRYSNTFEDNRISKDMLLDLNKDILIDMGVTAMGDIINIIKHAKKMHSLDSKKKDSVIPTVPKTAGAASNKRPPPPAAHSTTTPGQASTVSTTSSSAAKKKKIEKYAKREVPDSLFPEADPNITYFIVEPSSEEVIQHSIKSKPSLDDYQAEYYVENKEPPEPLTEMIEECDFQETYEASQYESRQNKRPMMMYSDEPDEISPSKQPRVIILPGEGQDIFTTAALRKAAKEYESGEEQVGRVATDRSRRLLESAGLIPSTTDKNPGNSVFSRLDYKPSVVVSSDSEFPATQQETQDSSPPKSRRIIKLSKGSSDGGAIASSSSSSSSKQSVRRSVISGTPQKRKVTSSNSTSRVLSVKTIPTSTSTKLLPSMRQQQQPEPRKISSRLGTKMTSNLEPTKSHDRGAIVASTSGSSRDKRMTAKSGLKDTGKRSTMVADEYEYQTQRQQDIRSRLERRESEKRSRRGGPLAGRLASHQIFGRLE